MGKRLIVPEFSFPKYKSNSQGSINQNKDIRLKENHFLSYIISMTYYFLQIQIRGERKMKEEKKNAINSVHFLLPAMP